jgi:hypothetical protein
MRIAVVIGFFVFWVCACMGGVKSYSFVVL